jgi:hypothetical protein
MRRATRVDVTQGGRAELRSGVSSGVMRHASAVCLAAFAAFTSTARAQPVPIFGEPTGAPSCTVDGPDARRVTVACAGEQAPATYVCTTLLVAEVHLEPGLETIVDCALEGSADQVAEGLVAIRSQRRFVWAMRRPELSGASADALRLRLTGPALQQVLFHVADEDQVELWVVGWTGMGVERVLRVTEAWGLADPDTIVEVRYAPGAVPSVETTTTPMGGRTVRRRFQWRAGEILFRQTSGPR